MSELALALIPSPESLPEPHGFDRLRSAVLNGVASENSRRSYGLALDELSAFSHGATAAHLSNTYPRVSGSHAGA